MLRIASSAWARLREDVLSRLPEEACGILLGRGDTVLEAYPCRNAHPGDRTKLYELDPQDQFDCLRHARERSLEWVAYYHSHPNGSTEFSATDRALAPPGSRHVIVAVRGGEVLPPRAYGLASAGGAPSRGGK